MPREAFLLVTPPAGETFVARSAGPSGGIDESNGALRFKEWPSALDGHRSTVLEIEPDGSLGEPGWFADVRLHRPGRYRLQLMLGCGVAGKMPFDSLRHVVTGSSFAELEVLEPRGDDAVVWNAVRADMATAVTSAEVARERRAAWKELVTKYPDSAYAGWLLTTGVTETIPESSALMREWLARHPAAPHADARWLLVAEHELGFSSAARDESRAAVHDKEARRLLKQLAGAKSSAVRRKAEELLKDLDE